MIRHFDDRLEIANSGPLPAQVTVENIAHERFARNVRIARTLSDFGYVRELNEGVPRIYRAMREFTLEKPEYAVDGTTVTLTLRNKVSDHRETILSEVLGRIEEQWSSLTKSQQGMIGLLLDKQEATIAEMAEAVDLSEQAVRYNLKKFEELAIVERLSEKIRDRNALYRFKSA